LALQASESLGEDVRRYPLWRGEEIPIAPLPTEQVADQEQGPAVADHIERTGDRAGRSLRAARSSFRHNVAMMTSHL